MFGNTDVKQQGTAQRSAVGCWILHKVANIDLRRGRKETLLHGDLLKIRRDESSCIRSPDPLPRITGLMARLTQDRARDCSGRLIDAGASAYFHTFGVCVTARQGCDFGQRLCLHIAGAQAQSRRHPIRWTVVKMKDHQHSSANLRSIEGLKCSDVWRTDEVGTSGRSWGQEQSVPLACKADDSPTPSTEALPHWETRVNFLCIISLWQLLTALTDSRADSVRLYQIPRVSLNLISPYLSNDIIAQDVGT